MSLSFRFCTLPPSVRFSRSLHPPRSSAPPQGLGASFLPLQLNRPLKLSLGRSIVASAASHEESHSEIEVESEKSQLDVKASESQEAWKQTLESFREQAIKMQGLSQEAYEVYSKKAMVILMKTSKQLKIQAEKASQDLAIIAKEISEEGREYLSAAAENSSDEVKDIVKTFASSTNELKQVSEVRDFYLGIPYGTFLSLGGFLSFMLTGSISAIRFGIVLGGALLALSISSLRAWKRGEASALFLKGQAAIAVIIFLRELRLFFQRATFPTSFMTLISGIMVIFYFYRVMIDGEKKGPSAELSPED